MSRKEHDDLDAVYSLGDVQRYGFRLQRNSYCRGLHHATELLLRRLNITSHLAWQTDNAKRNVTFICAENKQP